MATETFTQIKVKTAESVEAAVATGPAAAAMISGGIGTLIIGVLTTGAVIIEGLADLLNWWNPAGPLTGKTGVGVIAWLLAWFVLNTVLRNKDYDLEKAFRITLILIGIGLVLTFPPVFEAFE